VIYIFALVGSNKNNIKCIKKLILSLLLLCFLIFLNRTVNFLVWNKIMAIHSVLDGEQESTQISVP